MKRTALLLLAVLVASGCAHLGDSQDPENMFQNLIDQRENSTFQVDYRISSSKDIKVNASFYKTNNTKKYVQRKDTAGGLFTASSYRLGNHTVVCEESPGFNGRQTSCSVGQSEKLYSYLDLEKMKFSNLTYQGTDKALGRSCKAFIADIGSNPGSFDLGKSEKATICISEKGVPLKLNVSSENNYLSYTAVDISSSVNTESAELPRSVAIVGHCTGSFDVGITPLKDVQNATISINGFSKSVKLPERFTSNLYELPEEKINVGTNEITVSAGGEVQSSTCYRRE